MVRPLFVGICAIVSLGGCGGGSTPSPVGDAGGVAGGDAGSTDPNAPVFLSFGSSVVSITIGESVIFSAVLTDPDGIDDVIGGSLKSPDGTVVYGTFSTSGQEGSYSLTLSWDMIDQSQPITFEGDDQKSFVAEFFDVAGHRATKSAQLRLHCDGGGGAACSGRCTSLDTSDEDCGGCGNQCPTPAPGFGGSVCRSRQCVAVFSTGDSQGFEPPTTPTSCNAVCAVASPGATCAPLCNWETGVNLNTRSLGDLVGYDRWADKNNNPSCFGVHFVTNECAFVPPTTEIQAPSPLSAECDGDVFPHVFQQCCCAVPPT